MGAQVAKLDVLGELIDAEIQQTSRLLRNKSDTFDSFMEYKA